MDISRPDIKRSKRKKTFMALLILGVSLVLVSYGVSRYEPSAPVVHRSLLWIGKVQRGEMLWEVRGNGTLAPTRMLSIQSATGGTVEEILLWPGTEVQADSVILKLSNAELDKQLFDLKWQLRAAEATLNQLEAELEQSAFTQESSIAILKSDWEQAQLEADASEALSEQRLEPVIKVKAARAKADSLKIKYELEQRKLEFHKRSAKAKLEVQQAELEKLRAELKLKQRHHDALAVKAGISGVLQQLGGKEPLEVGQRISANSNLAKVVRPEALKAVILIPETQAKEIKIGQTAVVDMRDSWINGRVSRVDPSVTNGSVSVDIALLDTLPEGARPDMSVDARIEIERLPEALYAGRIVNAQSETIRDIFVLSADGKEAIKKTVHIGRASVSSMEIREGLQDGDSIILSETTRWEDVDRIKIQP